MPQQTEPAYIFPEMLFVYTVFSQLFTFATRKFGLTAACFGD